MEAESNSSSVAEFFRGRSVFITGGTGFVGKTLIARLLTACPDVAAIYVLVRPKKGANAEERLRALMRSPVLADLAKSDKVRAVAGDITQEKLGLSQEDAWRLRDEVSVVFHSAATVRFDEPLSSAVAMNIRGVDEVLSLASKMVQLCAFVHVSTAYSQCNKGPEEVIHERIYGPSDITALQLMDIVKCLPAKLLDDDAVTKKLIGDRPNTYTFTKALAESMVWEHRDAIPLAIVRPSIVVASLKDPVPGFVDNLNGPTGLIAAAGAGVVHTVLVERSFVADWIPVDIVANVLITAAFHIGCRSKSRAAIETPIFNCTSGNVNPLTWGDVERIMYRYLLRHPMERLVWYPSGSFKSSRLVHDVCRFFFHAIPAHVIDAIARVFGHKPFLRRLHARIDKTLRVLEFFTTNEWRWSSSNVEALEASLSDGDKKAFPLSVASMSWEKYLESYVLGTRHYVLGNEPSSIEASRKNLNLFHLIHLVGMGLIIFLTMFALYQFTDYMF